MTPFVLPSVYMLIAKDHSHDKVMEEDDETEHQVKPA
jgi:multidrug efflux pump